LAAISGPNLITQQRYRLAARLDPALGEQLLDVAEAQREAEIQPNGMADHVRRKPGDA
jgi:hypothetical protein